MLNILLSVVLAGLGFFKTRCRLAIEVLALRHQLGVLKRSVKRPRLTNADRGLWVLLSRRWTNWSDALIIVKPATVIRWHRSGFRKYWAWRSRPKGGRPAIDSRQLLCVVLAGDARLVERLRRPELLPLGSRIRRRLVLDYATRDELLACLDHLLETAGNPSLMTTELKTTLADHAAGNSRIMMNLADELLATAVERDLERLDEKLYLDAFAQTPKKKAPRKRRAPASP